MNTEPRGEWKITSFDVGKHYEQHFIAEKADPNPAVDGWWHVAQVKHADDAHLIAAAPELLDTCEALAAFTRDLLKLLTPGQIKAARLTTRMLRLNDQAFNVIAKARGRS